ncbi:hypothetical protein DMC30DRAFT_81813 [Rhodotorula diobovata]|uniref:Uncharacterized protein n=1 Tax=Rhodotorula diobovata TaxID=5288 RepID=A0A5C5FMF0_9BASI|nr:hypothetical protein DMC30DRAFT_81813 [Rhodotorula diobovata]
MPRKGLARDELRREEGREDAPGQESGRAAKWARCVFVSRPRPSCSPAAPLKEREQPDTQKDERGAFVIPGASPPKESSGKSSPNRVTRAGRPAHRELHSSGPASCASSRPSSSESTEAPTERVREREGAGTAPSTRTSQRRPPPGLCSTRCVASEPHAPSTECVPLAALLITPLESPCPLPRARRLWAAGRFSRRARAAVLAQGPPARAGEGSEVEGWSTALNKACLVVRAIA